MLKHICYMLTIITSIIVFGGLFSSSNQVVAIESYDAVYFASRYCEACIALESDGVLDNLDDEGFSLKRYHIEDDSSYTGILRNYQYSYGVPLEKNQIPVLFVGDTYYIGREAIRNAILSNEIQDIMINQNLLPVIPAPASGFNIIYFILLGLVDGVNPCAIAMLLMFISLLSFSKKKRVLLGVSLTFISAIFLSYFLFGTILYRYLSSFGAGSLIARIIPWIIVGIAGILFLLNAYDFVITLLQRYDKIKNQLPKGIQKFNRKLMQSFTNKMEEGSPGIYLVTFLIGFIISFTEFLCTGQAYLTAILHLIHFTDFIGRGVILLLFYNLIFVLPLIIIALIAIKTQSIVSVSSFMRERLHWIKLFNAIVFLIILVYYLFFIILR
ncbi:MAG: hypothetical protein IH571_06860 [Acholeplasmataceae bacterium]|nr:hypothetical protein [Acholeplasmataceae bacterium]